LATNRDRPERPYPLEVIAPPQPATGQQLTSIQLHDRFWCRLVLFRITLSTSAAAGARRVTLSCGDGQGSTLWSVRSVASQAGSLIIHYEFARVDNTLAFALAGGLNSDDVVLAACNQHIPPSMNLTLTVTNLDPADALLTPRIIRATLETKPLRVI